MVKILIGSLVSKHHAYCTDEFLEGLKSVKCPNMEVDIFLVENSDNDEFYNWLITKIWDKIKVIRYGNSIKSTQEKLVVCRNYLRDLFLNGDYDYFFSVDQDVVVNGNIVENLIKDNKNIVCGICYNNKVIEGKTVQFPVIYRKYNSDIQEYMINNKEKVRQLNPELFFSLEKYNWNFEWVHKILTPEDIQGKGLIEIDYCGNACVMIKKEVLEKVKFRFEGEFFDDVLFCKDAAMLGYKIYADCSLKCKHILDNRPWKWQKTNGIMEIKYL